MKPSPFRPNCHSDERICFWTGIHAPPVSTIDSPNIHFLVDIASRASLCDMGSYRSGLQKFHVFCDIFSILKSDHLPASFKLLHSFAIWAVSNPSLLVARTSTTQFKTISVTTIRKYLAAMWAWHIAQGWPAPLSEEHHNCINWSLCGLENIQGSHKKPVHPPVRLPMLQVIKAALNISEPFDACIWAICLCAYWGMMWLREVTVNSCNTFDKSKQLTWKDTFFWAWSCKQPLCSPGFTNHKDCKTQWNPICFSHYTTRTVPPRGSQESHINCPCYGRWSSLLMVRQQWGHSSNGQSLGHGTCQQHSQHMGLGNYLWPFILHRWCIILLIAEG